MRTITSSNVLGRHAVLAILSVSFLLQTFGGAQELEKAPSGNTESRTICKITSGDVEATAEATISRNPDGACTADELARQLRTLELKLMQELVNIKAMLAQQYSLSPDFQVPLPTSYLNTLEPLKEAKTDPKPDSTFYFPTAPEVSQGFEKQRMPSQTPELKSLVTGPRKSNTLLRSRESEIHSFNNTILKAGDAKIFTYFWKLENFSSHLTGEEHEVFSPVFTIESLNLRAIATFNQLQREFLVIRVEEVSDEFLKTQKKPSISIVTSDSVNMFHRIEIRKQFKHKIIIMDQGVPATDLISQDFYNTNGGFSIPTSAIMGDRYARGDVVLIRLVIYI